MRKFYKTHILLCVIILTTSINLFSQNTNNLWQEINDSKSIQISDRSSMPSSYRAFELDLPQIISLLNQSLDETQPGAFDNGPILSLPMPDGSFSNFRAANTIIMEKGLSDKFPTIRTFTAKNIDDPYVTARLDYTQWGFHAMIMSPKGWVLIDPASLGNNTTYICYNRSSSVPVHDFVCGLQNSPVIKNNISPNVYRSSGSILKTYRLALACTGEYAAFYGGTVSGALAGMVTSINRVDGVYELEQAVRMVLVANTNLLVYTNASTDPYSNNNGSTMLGQNQSNVTTVIGSANYDFGHVFSTGGGGIASLGCICSSGNKAKGVTGLSTPVGDEFDLDYVAHEMGHQFGGNHTFNSTTGSCNGNNEPTAAYEPGSGTTIQAYAGICGSDDIQLHSDPIFHTKSFDEIQDYITTGNGNSCDVATATSNTPPVVSSAPNYTIPFQTPFILTGHATDADNDPLTYLWEQFDLGPAGHPNSPSGDAPIFRDWVPVPENYRIFPRMQDVVRNTQTKGEILPSYARILHFRLTARDNRLNGGGVAYNDTLTQVTVINTTTPFKVTNPNTAVTWNANTSYTVTWDVSSTNAAPINCANVNILLSLDSGYTYPFTLITNTPNDGSESVTIPNTASTKARVKVEGAGNIFFDISNVNFTITSSSIMTTLSTTALSSNTICAGSTFNVSYTTNGPANAGNIFTVQLSNASGSFANPDTIGTLTSINAGTISVTIPGGTAAGTGYLIRVVSSNPAITGTNNGSNITISQSAGTPGTITGTSTVCQGQTGVAFSIPTITNASTYVWSFPTGANITSGAGTNNLVVDFGSSASSGTVTVRGANTGCGNGPFSSPFSITVNPLPAAAGTITGNSTVCQGQTGVVYSVPSIAGVTGYSWTLPSGASIASGANSNSITVDFAVSAVSGIISAAGTNACGNGSSSNFSVTIITVPSAPAIAANGSTSFCQGDSVILSYTQSGNTAYQWRKNGVKINGATNASYAAIDSGTYDVAAGMQQVFSNSNGIAIPDNSCTGVNSIIAVSGYTGTVSSSGISVQLNITHTYVGNLILLLQTPNGSLLGLSNRTGNNTNSGNNFTNTIFSDAGAGVLPATGAPYTGTYKPVAAIFSGCALTTTTVTFASLSGGAINPNGNWILRAYDNAAGDTGRIVNWTITIPASANAPCTAVSNAISVNVSPVPITSFTYNQNGAQVTFTNTSLNAASYLWNFGDGDTSTLTSPVHTYTQNGNYAVVLAATDSCGASVDTQYVNITGLSVNDHLFSDSEIKIIKNDAGVNILFNSNIDFCNYYLTNVSGQIIFSGRKEKIISGSEEHFSLEGLAAGIYYLHIRSEDKSMSRLLYKLK